MIFDPLNILLLAMALVVFWRLRSVLGGRTGHERRPPDSVSGSKYISPGDHEATLDSGTQVADNENKPAGQRDAKSESGLPIWHGYADSGSAIANTLEALKLADPGFSPARFLEGARLAYEMVLEAFAKGDKTALKPLLSREVFESFSTAIDARISAEQRLEFRFVGVERSKLSAAAVSGRKASMTVEFAGEMISATFDRHNKLIDGDVSQIRKVSDVWTFERDVGSRDPNWKLAATGAVN